MCNENKTKRELVTITFPRPIAEITSEENVIINPSEGDCFSVWEAWYGGWTEEMLGRHSKEELYDSINQEYFPEIESGFLFENKQDAEEFLNAMRELVIWGGQ